MSNYPKHRAQRWQKWRPWVRHLPAQKCSVLVEFTEAMQVDTPAYYYHFECKKSDMEAQARVRNLLPN